MNLKAQATDEKVTLGLSEAILGDNAKAKEIFGFLQSKKFSKDREGFILGDVFADGVVRNGGFTEFAEKVNGRVAMLAFPLGLTETFNGDLLDQLAAHPVQVIKSSRDTHAVIRPPLRLCKHNDVLAFNLQCKDSNKKFGCTLFFGHAQKYQQL